MLMTANQIRILYQVTRGHASIEDFLVQLEDDGTIVVDVLDITYSISRDGRTIGSNQNSNIQAGEAEILERPFVTCLNCLPRVVEP